MCSADLKIMMGFSFLSELKHYSFTKRNLISKAAYLKVHSERATPKKTLIFHHISKKPRKKSFKFSLKFLRNKHNILVMLFKFSQENWTFLGNKMESLMAVNFFTGLSLQLEWDPLQ